MPTTTKSKGIKNPTLFPNAGRKFTTVEEAAQAKTDQVWNTVLKYVNWEKFETLRNQG